MKRKENDEKFDKLMNAYVASTARDKDFDLAKVKSEEKSRQTVRHRNVVIATSIAAVFIICLSIGIALPLTLPTDTDDNTFYSQDITDFEFIGVTAQEVRDIYGNEIIFSSYDDTLDENSVAYDLLYTKDHTLQFGVRFSYYVRDDIFDNICIYVVDDEYTFSHVDNIDFMCDENGVWGSIEIRYGITADPVGFNNYYCTFTYGSKTYYLRMEAYSGASIQEILDMVF